MTPRTSPALRDEVDADVLDSLRYLGPSSIGELAADTGRTRGQVLGACLRLVGSGRARETYAGWGRRFAATRGFGAALAASLRRVG